MRISVELIQQAEQTINPIKERTLNLRGMKLATIENLSATLDCYDCINFSDNNIQKLGNFSYLGRLKTIIIANNNISKIANIGLSLPNLENVILTNNKITALSELDSLSTCTKLKRLSLVNNQVAQAENYRFYLIAKIPSLKILDFQKITLKEREEAKKLFVQEEEDDDDSFIDKKEKIQVLLFLNDYLSNQEAIKQAKSQEEINKLELLLKSGELDDTIFKMHFQKFFEKQ